MTSVATKHPAEDSVEYWLVILLNALRGSDLESAVEAQRELKQRGLDVRPCSLLRRGHPS